MFFALALTSLLADGLVVDHPNCNMTPLNKDYSVCFLSSAGTDGKEIHGTDASIGTVVFVNKKGEMLQAVPGRYTVDPAIADPKKYPPFIVRENADYRSYIGASTLSDGTPIEFYNYDGLGQSCETYTISADGKQFKELADGNYTLKNGQAFKVENGVIDNFTFDPDTGKLIDPLSDIGK